MSIPCLVISAFCILFFYLNNSYFKNLDSVSLASMNLVGVAGRWWVVLVCYALPGLLIALFGILCRMQSLKGSIGRFAYPLICISGISWASLSFNPINQKIDDPTLIILLIKIFITLFSGTLGFVLLAIQHKEVRLSSSYKIALYLLIGAIVIESVINFMSVTIYSTISYTAFFLVFAILGMQFKNGNSQSIKLDEIQNYEN